MTTLFTITVQGFAVASAIGRSDMQAAKAAVILDNARFMAAHDTSDMPFDFYREMAEQLTEVDERPLVDNYGFHFAPRDIPAVWPNFHASTSNPLEA